MMTPSTSTHVVGWNRADLRDDPPVDFPRLCIHTAPPPVPPGYRISRDTRVAKRKDDTCMCRPAVTACPNVEAELLDGILCGNYTLGDLKSLCHVVVNMKREMSSLRQRSQARNRRSTPFDIELARRVCAKHQYELYLCRHRNAKLRDALRHSALLGEVNFLSPTVSEGQRVNKERKAMKSKVAYLSHLLQSARQAAELNDAVVFRLQREKRDLALSDSRKAAEVVGLKKQIEDLPPPVDAEAASMSKEIAVDRLRVELEIAASQAESAKKRRNELDDFLKKSKNQQAHLEKDLEKAKKTLEAHKTHKDEMTVQVNQLTEATGNLSSQLKSLEGEREKLRQRLDLSNRSTEQAEAALKKESEAWSKQKEEMRRQLKEHREGRQKEVDEEQRRHNEFKKKARAERDEAIRRQEELEKQIASEGSKRGKETQAKLNKLKADAEAREKARADEEEARLAAEKRKVEKLQGEIDSLVAQMKQQRSEREQELRRELQKMKKEREEREQARMELEKQHKDKEEALEKERNSRIKERKEWNAKQREKEEEIKTQQRLREELKKKREEEIRNLEVEQARKEKLWEEEKARLSKEAEDVRQGAGVDSDTKKRENELVKERAEKAAKVKALEKERAERKKAEDRAAKALTELEALRAAAQHSEDRLKNFEDELSGEKQGRERERRKMAKDAEAARKKAEEMEAALQQCQQDLSALEKIPRQRPSAEVAPSPSTSLHPKAKSTELATESTGVSPTSHEGKIAGPKKPKMQLPKGFLKSKSSLPPKPSKTGKPPLMPKRRVTLAGKSSEGSSPPVSPGDTPPMQAGASPPAAAKTPSEATPLELSPDEVVQSPKSVKVETPDIQITPVSEEASASPENGASLEARAMLSPVAIEVRPPAAGVPLAIGESEEAMPSILEEEVEETQEVERIRPAQKSSGLGPPASGGAPAEPGKAAVASGSPAEFLSAPALPSGGGVSPEGDNNASGRQFTAFASMKSSETTRRLGSRRGVRLTEGLEKLKTSGQLNEPLRHSESKWSKSSVRRRVGLVKAVETERQEAAAARRRPPARGATTDGSGGNDGTVLPLTAENLAKLGIDKQARAADKSRAVLTGKW